ncbi:MAG: nucleotidyltransferase domain-containing protein [Deltaproteobacteria bacterium]|nr:nucleotidyltransferase domain-containing protein [Deltaproteobacteria bacterium]
MGVDQKEIDKLVQGIVSEIRPIRIILFGSAARTDLRTARDVDLLVVVPEGSHRRQTAMRLYRSLSGIRIPYDLVVATVGDLERHRDNPGLIYRSALKEGRVLYAT